MRVLIFVVPTVKYHSKAYLKRYLSEAAVQKFNMNDTKSKEELAESKVILESVCDLNNPMKRKLDINDEEFESIAKYSKKICSSSIEDAKYNETEYYFENGLRKVYPYYFTYSTFCKGRWVGRPLLEIFSDEFRAHTKAQYETHILSGALKVNGKQVGIDYKLSDLDHITNKVHRHELAVIAAPIKIIHFCNDLVVVDKPPSVPVHPCGLYRHNSLIFILEKEHNLRQLHTIHRLDRLTSGLLLFGRTAQKSKELGDQIRLRQVEKEYVCRVEGNFPDEIITCDKPIECISQKVGVCIVSPTGKQCSTEFEKLSYNGKSSVVLCKPLTGRMHQIRVHLQYLGFPIINDPVYNDDVFGPLKGKNGELGKTKECLLNDLLKLHNAENWLGTNSKSSVVNEDEQKDDVDQNIEQILVPPQYKTTVAHQNKVSLNTLSHYISAEEYKELELKYKKDPEKLKQDSNCDFCQKHYRDPQPKDLIMFLHALKYKGEGWEFKTDIPAWAKSDWTDM